MRMSLTKERVINLLREHKNDHRRLSAMEREECIKYVDSLSTEEKVVACFAKIGAGITFKDLEDDVGDEAKGDVCIFFQNNPNLILWTEISKSFYDAVTELCDMGAIVMKPASILEYAIEGGSINIPIAKRAGYKYKSPHWMPVSFSLSAELAKEAGINIPQES